MTDSWLLDKRSKKHLTQEQVAERSGIHRSYYTKIENGTMRPSVKVAKRISKVLGFKWTIFFDEVCDPRSQTK